MSKETIDNTSEKKQELHHAKYISGMYENWFLDYASYVILERAVPHIYDGLKPVQRRILHAMQKLDDGRFNKVANVIGYTMQYHPHGDASIGDALVQLGQKDLLVETQGNWGNILTGDNAAAARYIEARLSKFALDVAFNPKTTDWKLSYDGRNKEPVNLPMKFPLLLAQGVEGIAVGLASKILPHNFNELIDASINHLRGESFEIYPDFPTGGMADVSKYNDGLRGGKVRIRARICKDDKKILVIKEVPFGKTTGSLIDSILAANEKGKIKIKKIDDNTAQDVEILVHLAAGVSSDQTIDALYAFTDCEISISPNSCIIEDDTPKFLGVNHILKETVVKTKFLLTKELEIKKAELEESWHFSSLEKIFIENRIYITIEECETWEAIITTIDKGLEPFKPSLKREVTEEDITRLTEIKIKRISKYDAFKADEQISSLEEKIEETEKNLADIINYTIRYYQRIKDKYGKNYPRKTEIKNFDTIEATQVVVQNEKLYINQKDGFIGTSLKKDEYLFDCSDIDDVIVFKKDGTFTITKVADKLFVGQNILHVGLFKKNDNRTIYNVVYRDGRQGNFMAKRFAVTGITRDKEYNLTKGTKHSKVVYFSVNPNGEAETIAVILKPRARMKRMSFEFNFSEQTIKGRGAQGNILTKFDIHRIVLKEKGVSTLGGRKIWFDRDVNRINTEERGEFIGEFNGEDKILYITRSGSFHVTDCDVLQHFPEDILLIEKYNSQKIFSITYYEAELNYFYAKRFHIDTLDKTLSFIGENGKSHLESISSNEFPQVEIFFGGKDKNRYSEVIDLNDFIAVKSYKARGKRLTSYQIRKIERLDSGIQEKQEEEKISQNEDVQEINEDTTVFNLDENQKELNM